MNSPARKRPQTMRIDAIDRRPRYCRATLRFNKHYFWLASGLLLLEATIARYAHDQIVRPYAGDLLATVLLYCLGRSFLVARPEPVVVAALLTSYLLEGLQYLGLLHLLGWQHSQVARLVLGSHFAWGDMLAYSLGALAVLAAEQRLKPADTTRYRPRPRTIRPR